ncbi:tetratricopeptide repeat protein [Mucilaginibacter sp. RS28]|uniref:Tetratricopeptide repeat protein n=1 Tax=Mucilaginibacter straminoryzae TaxID=2932774 RepID=A0A9X1X3X2_9SPHI|nr:tetratricopeptide repeat protein [Mucilaginibacter straminoryzae]MCJ8210126.1 tetratricopeptide repeat protein [Mucilaginibacter straminoryzae]
MRLQVLFLGIAIASAHASYAQNAYVKLGQQALMEGDFKVAIQRLEKACVIDSTNADALWMLGYSYYHSNSYKKSISTYNKVIAVKPADATAYYYRARAKTYLGRDNSLTFQDKEKYLLGAIVDFTKAIALEPADFKYYQNRGIAYREYAVFKLDQSTKAFDKNRGINALRASIGDLEKVLNDNPTRADIASQLSLSKEKLATVEGHH